MTLHIHQEEYVDELAEAAGVRVVVHPQDRMPFPADEGILANPGQATSIGIKQVLGCATFRVCPVCPAMQF